MWTESWTGTGLLKLQSKADAFEYADQVLEKWYPSIEEGNNKGIVVLITSQKEGAITGGPAFIEAVGEKILDATVSENLPGTFSSRSGIDYTALLEFQYRERLKPSVFNLDFDWV